MQSIEQIVSPESVRLFAKSLENVLLSATKGANFDNKSDSARHLPLLREYFRSIEPQKTPEEVYEKSYIPFCSKYLLANLVKNYYCISELHQMGLLPSRSRILDLGCGPGAFEFAFLVWLKDHAANCSYKARITALDPVDKFLGIFQDTWKMIEAREKSNIQISRRSKMIEGPLENIESTDIIVLSSSLGEMLRDKRVNSKKLARSLMNTNCIILIVDYGYECLRSTFDSFLDLLSPEFDPVHYFVGQKWGRHFETIDLETMKSPCENRGILMPQANVKFIRTILVPKNRSGQRKLRESALLVDSYKKAWEEHDLNILQSLFAKGALYFEKENKKPFSGIGEICDYWRHNARVQEEVDFRTLYVDDKDRKTSAIWQCEFYRNDKKRRMRLKGIFEAQTCSGKIYHFSERFKKRVLP